MQSDSRIIPFPIPDGYSVNLSLYPLDAGREVSGNTEPEFLISQSDRDLLKAVIDRYDRNKYEELRNQVYNLTLYLSHIEHGDPTLFDALRDRFDGLPGYNPAILEGDDSNARPRPD